MSPHIVIYTQNNVVRVHVEGAGVSASSLPLMEVVEP